MRRGVRYRVRNARGEELVVPSLEDLAALYAQGFLADDDLVRAESSDRWVRAGAMGALAGARATGREGRPRQVALVLAMIVALAAALGLLLSRP